VQEEYSLPPLRFNDELSESQIPGFELNEEERDLEHIAKELDNGPLMVDESGQVVVRPIPRSSKHQKQQSKPTSDTTPRNTEPEPSRQNDTDHGHHSANENSAGQSRSVSETSEWNNIHPAMDSSDANARMGKEEYVNWGGPSTSQQERDGYVSHTTGPDLLLMGTEKSRQIARARKEDIDEETAARARTLPPAERLVPEDRRITDPSHSQDSNGSVGVVDPSTGWDVFAARPSQRRRSLDNAASQSHPEEDDLRNKVPTGPTLGRIRHNPIVLDSDSFRLTQCDTPVDGHATVGSLSDFLAGLPDAEFQSTQPQTKVNANEKKTKDGKPRYEGPKDIRSRVSMRGMALPSQLSSFTSIESNGSQLHNFPEKDVEASGAPIDSDLSYHWSDPHANDPISTAEVPPNQEAYRRLRKGRSDSSLETDQRNRNNVPLSIGDIFNDGKCYASAIMPYSLPHSA
jgi:hypothetical protein